MNSLIAFLVISALMPVVAVLMLRQRESKEWRRNAVAYQLRFSRETDPAPVVSFFSGSGGLVAPRWSRLIAARAIVFETTATEAGITHRVITRRDLAPLVLAQLRASLPNVSVEEVTIDVPGIEMAGEMAVSTLHRPLRNDPTAISAAVLASLQPLARDERAIVQYVVDPVGPTSATKHVLVEPLMKVVTSKVRDTSAAADERAKRAYPLFFVKARIGVSSGKTRRNRELLRQITAAFHSANAPGAHLYRRWVPTGRVARQINRRSLPLLPATNILNAAELAALVAFPVGNPQLPGLHLGGSRRLVPSVEIPAVGRVLARSNYPGLDRALALTEKDSLLHLHIIGPTGSGKTTVAENLIDQDMRADRGVIVVDPEGGLVNRCLDIVPSRREADVILLDPADEVRPVGLNPLEQSDDHELVVDQVVAVIHRLWASSWGPRSDDILRAALTTLVTVPGMTLVEIPRLLMDPVFRRHLVGQLDEPIALEPFWSWFDSLSDAERGVATGPVLNKLRSFLLRRRIRNVIGQASGGLDFESALRDRRIVLVALPKGLIGSEAAALLGSLVVAQLWNAVQRRTALPLDQRTPTFFYADEFHDFMSLPQDFADLLGQARKLGLGLCLLHQNLAQLPGSLRQAVLANARSRVIFQVSASDARTLARELTPYVSANDLQELGAREAILHLAVSARVAPPVTAITMPPPPSTGSADRVRRQSRERHGRDRADVEKSIRNRQTAVISNAPIGSRPRRSQGDQQ